VGRVGTGRLHLVDQRTEPVPAPGHADHQGPGLRQVRRQSTAEPGGGAGDDHHLSPGVHRSSHLPPPCRGAPGRSPPSPGLGVPPPGCLVPVSSPR
jgi:hypothetical protein